VFFRSYTPAAPLRDFVGDFWLYEEYEQPHAKERIVPSGTVELVINLRDDELRIYDSRRPDHCRRLRGAIVSRAYSGPFVIDTAEDAAVIGVHFKPGGAFPFLGCPAGDLTDTHVDLPTLWGPDAVELRERLCAATAPADRFASWKGPSWRTGPDRWPIIRPWLGPWRCSPTRTPRPRCAASPVTLGGASGGSSSC
jgi:hypothetical protein